jgi:ribosomal protein S12 methylthiotransferase accessory factor
MPVSLDAPLHERAVKTHFGGAHRAVDPEETLARIAPHQAAMGITRVANVTGLDRIGLPVVMVCRPNSRSLAVSQGKGASLAAAKASGLMESIELHHAEHLRCPLLYGAARDLGAREGLVDLERLPRARGGRLDRAAPNLWVRFHSLDGAREALAPFEVAHASAASPPPPGSGVFLSTSNGLASGNTLAEAVLHGLCELIERDATTLWELGGLAPQAASRVDLQTVDDPHCRGILERFEAADFDVALFETTSDVGLPAFLAEITDRLWDMSVPLRSFTGMGCHTSRGVALSRALTEAAQCRLTMISGARDDLFREEYRQAPRRVGYAARHGAARLQPGARDFRAAPDLSTPSFAGDLQAVAARLEALGVAVWHLDLTLPEFGLPVARVIAPGLEGPDEAPDYVPGERAQRARRRAEAA